MNGLATETRTQSPLSFPLTADSFKSLIELCPHCPTAIHVASVKRRRLPSGHRFYTEPDREQWARLFDWVMHLSGMESWFATLTFRNYTRTAVAEAMCGLWLAKLNQALKDSGAERLKWIRATEWQVRDVIHFHLLLMARGLNSLSRKRHEVRWWNAGGGFCRIYEAERSAAPYLAKELTKTRGGEVKLGGCWREECPGALNVPGVSSKVLAFLQAGVSRRAEGVIDLSALSRDLPTTPD